MTAYESRQKLKIAIAKVSIKRIFPVIQKAIDKGEDSIKISLGSGTTGFNEEEISVLQKEYGYTVDALYDDSGDFHRSDKKIGYWIKW